MLSLSGFGKIIGVGVLVGRRFRKAVAARLSNTYNVSHFHADVRSPKPCCKLPPARSLGTAAACALEVGCSSRAERWLSSEHDLVKG